MLTLIGDVFFTSVAAGVDAGALLPVAVAAAGAVEADGDDLLQAANKQIEPTIMINPITHFFLSIAFPLSFSLDYPQTIETG